MTPRQCLANMVGMCTHPTCSECRGHGVCCDGDRDVRCEECGGTGRAPCVLCELDGARPWDEEAQAVCVVGGEGVCLEHAGGE